MPTPAELIASVQACPLGVPGWRAFEDAATAALTHFSCRRCPTPRFRRARFLELTVVTQSTQTEI